MQKTIFYEFQGFYVDLKQKRLWKNGEIVSLTPKAFDTLIFLLQNRGEVIAKEKILDEVWAETFVDEATLSQNIYTLRKVLGTLPNGTQIIETIPRRGFLFNSEVREIVDDESATAENQSASHVFIEQIADDQTHFASADKKTKGKAVFAVASLLIVALVGVFFAFRFLQKPTNWAETKFREVRMSKLVSGGEILRVAISPNGKYLAYVEKKDDLQTLFLREINNANTLEVIPPGKDEFIGITFSPDSDYIHYTVYQEMGENVRFKLGVLYKVPVLGGTRCEVVTDIDSPATFSPDGDKIAFVRNSYIDKKQSVITIKDIPTNFETKLAARDVRERFTSEGIAWSPDGKFIAAFAMNPKTPQKPLELIVANVKNGEQTSLFSESWSKLGQIAWLTDGSGIIFPAGGNQTDNLNGEVWLATFPNGNLRQIAGGINSLRGLGISADSNAIIAVKSNATKQDDIVLIKDVDAQTD